MKPLFDLETLNHRYVIGIDLGTTNSAVAYVDLREETEGDAARTIRFFEIPQLIAEGEVAGRPVLPSFLYLPGAYDLPPGSAVLPWKADRDFIVGEFAREQGARVPGRLVASAKSWLCHAGVDRSAAILPWGAAAEVPKVSPVLASMRYLQHMREAWNARMSEGKEEQRFEKQLLILTVPASFDEVARELTVAAAKQAGLTRIVLIEEPMAACYAWLSDHDETWHDLMEDGHLILVCDVGGGTSDFSIVGLREGEQGLRFNRLAVGEHLLLGGDNMDYTLGRYVETEMAGQPGKLDAQRWHQLVHQCRGAKETLLGAPEDHAPVEVTLMGAAGKLIAGTLKSSLSHEDVRRLILDGFFPEVAPGEMPGESRRKGLTELGLPYVHDPAITRHLAAFWQRYEAYLREETGRTEVYPDHILFNGGVFTPEVVRERLQQIIAGWFQPQAGAGWTPTELSNPRLDLAVAMGAAYYGLVRLGEGVRIGSGSPRTYYVGVEANQQDTEEELHTGVCLVPRGTEEGFATQLGELNFEALTNQPVAFQVFTSSTRLGDTLGEVVHLDSEETTVLPSIRTVLQYGKKGVAQRLPVQLAVRLTEIGTLELWCQSLQSSHRWQLQFDVRSEADANVQDVEITLDEQQIERAVREIHKTFESDGHRPPPEGLRKQLEKILDMPRNEWPIPVLRKLADTLLACTRGRTPGQEARWFNLLGYCLRPGFGDPADEWRMQQAWKVFMEGLQFPQKVQCRSEWWVFWRRIAGGLPANKQLEVYHDVRPYIQLNVRTKKRHRIYPKRMESREQRDVWMALGSFERLPAEIKVTLGRMLLQKLKTGKPQNADLWSISRMGARMPMYGPLDSLVPADEISAWIKALLTSYIDKKPNVAHALVNLTRYTGDRGRDVPEDTRHQVYRWLRKVPDTAYFRDLLTDPESSQRQEEQEWMFGESLPTGLVLSLDA